MIEITINYTDIRYQHAKTKRKHPIKVKFGDIDNSSIYSFLDDFQLIHAS